MLLLYLPLATSANRHLRPEPRPAAVCLLLLLACLLYPPAGAGAQSTSPRFTHLTAEQGLSHEHIFDILQDRQGFIWIGTQDGLDRYDGYTMTVFRHRPSDPYSLAGNTITALLEDSNGVIWAGTPDGLDSFSPDAAQGPANGPAHVLEGPPAGAADRVVHYGAITEQVNVLLEGHDGAVWIGTSGKGLYRYDRKTATFRAYQHDPQDPGSLADDLVTALWEDRRGTLWIGTATQGIDALDGGIGPFIHHHNDPSDPGSLSDDRVMSIFEDRSGILWVGTGAANEPEGGGLNAYDRGSGRFTRYLRDSTNLHSLSSNNVTAIYEDRAGTLWLGTDSGLATFDPSRRTFTHHVPSPLVPTSLAGSHVTTIFEDRSGVLWIGTEEGGVSKYAPAKDRFERIVPDPLDTNSLHGAAIGALLEDHNGILWIGIQNSGLDRFDPAGGAYTHYAHDPANPASLGHNHVRALYEDRNGNLWVGTNGGLDRFDPQTGGFVHYRHDPANASSLGSGKVRAILEDHAGELWVALLEPGSLDRLVPSKGTFRHYEHDAANPTSLMETYGLTAIHEDETGALWLGTYSGLERLDPTTGTFLHYKHDPGNAASLSHDFTWSIYEDRMGAIWVGTDGGLDRLDPATGRFVAYTVENGLPTDQVKAILADERGRLWLGIDGGGVSSFDPQTGVFRNFDLSDGLAGRDAVVGAYARGSSGKMYFGTLTGVTTFRSDDVKLNAYVPPIVLSAFRRFDRPVSLDRPLSRIDALALSYEDSFFAFEFAALDYTDPAKNRYAYQLIGFDQDWIQSGTRRYASYTNLAPGTYTFRVKAANNDGVWNEAGPAVRVIIEPPFWQTWWFRTLAAAIILGAIAIVIRTREAYVATLRASEERFRAIFDQAPLFVCELETTASPPRILRANRASERVFGRPAVALHDLPFTTLLPPGSWAALEPMFKSLAPEKTLDCECAALRQNGSQFPARLSLTGGTGQQSGRSILVMEDITAEKERRSEEQAIADERQRIAREIHDGLAQDLAGIRFRIALWHHLVDSDPIRMHTELVDLQTLLAKDIRDVRRSIFALRPLVLDELGFLPALRRFIHEFAEQNQLAVDLQVGGLEEVLPSSLELVLFRIIQESLHNVSKHAMAATACVSITRESAETLKLTVSDDGLGFEADRLDMAVASGHLGLKQMKERVQKLGGSLNIRSGPGAGTEIETILPLSGEGDRPVYREEA